MKKKIFLFAIIAIVFLGLNIINDKKFVKASNNAQNSETTDESSSNHNDSCHKEEDEIMVEVKGLVVKPGVYKMTKGDRIVDLIERSGGLLGNADISCINQTTILTDQMLVIIMSSKEVNEVYKNNNTEPTESVIITPNENTTNTNEDEVIEVCTCEFIKVDKTNEATSKSNLISLNNAPMQVLITLPGIGESKAKAIIEYRSKTPFTDIAEITNVSGIGNSTYEKIKHLITK